MSDKDGLTAKSTTIALSRMKARQEGVVVEIHGGRGLIQRLDAMGIRIGVRIIKLSAQFMQGPVIAKAGATQIALGFGMAQKIIVSLR